MVEIRHDEDLHDIKLDFELVDLSEHDDHENISIVINGKDAKVR